MTASLAAGLLLVVLCGITAVTGTSQQWFEWVHGPEVYAARLVAESVWLRAIIATDDMFIAAYVVATLLLARRLAVGGWSPLTLAIALGGAAAGILDLQENHDILSMLRSAELSLTIGTDAIVARSDLSQLKWLLGHLAFVLAGVVWPSRATWVDRFLVFSLIALQMPVGVLVWTVEEGPWRDVLIWIRHASFVTGFFLIAWTMRPRDALGERSRISQTVSSDERAGAAIDARE